jgi:hypothetical protein
MVSIELAFAKVEEKADLSGQAAPTGFNASRAIEATVVIAVISFSQLSKRHHQTRRRDNG